MQLQIDTEGDLYGEHEHEHGGHGGVHIGSELSTAVGVAEEVAGDGEDGAHCLERDVPSGTHDLEGSVGRSGLIGVEEATYSEDHPRGEDDAEGKDLY